MDEEMFVLPELVFVMSKPKDWFVFIHLDSRRRIWMRVGMEGNELKTSLQLSLSLSL